jgi:serine/threonine protein kinase
LSESKNFLKGNRIERLENVKRMLKIAGGLKWLAEHVVDIYGDMSRQDIWHLDLHWGNILVCGNPRVFKIGDFGDAIRRQTSESKRPSQHSNRTSAFSAPESEPTETSDVWSFGCLLLLVLVFNYECVGGLNEFMASLLRHANVDCFYDRTTQKANQETVGCIRHLYRRIEKESDRLVTIGLLELLEKDILVPVKQRKTISQVEDTMVECLKKQHTVEPKMRIERHIIKGKGYRHCGHSPDARFEIFHHDKDTYTMSIWIWHQGVATELPLLEPISVPRLTPETSQMERIYTRSSCCGKDYVCQVVANRNPLEVSKVYAWPYFKGC